MKGETNFQTNTINIINRNIPHCSRKLSINRKRAGRKENKIFEPSSGGIGIKLNRARTKFIITMIDAIA